MPEMTDEELVQWLMNAERTRRALVIGGGIYSNVYADAVGDSIKAEQAIRERFADLRRQIAKLTSDAVAAGDQQCTENAREAGPASASR